MLNITLFPQFIVIFMNLLLLLFSRNSSDTNPKQKRFDSFEVYRASVQWSLNCGLSKL